MKQFNIKELERITKFCLEYKEKNEYNPKFLNEYNKKFNKEFNEFLLNGNFSEQTIKEFTK